MSTFEHIPLVFGMTSSFPIEVQAVANKTSSHHSSCTDYGYLDSAHDDSKLNWHNPHVPARERSGCGR